MRIPLSLLKVGQQRCVWVGETSVLVCRTTSGIYAVENRCTHYDSPLQGGAIEGDAIRCPFHGIKYDLRTGKPFTMAPLDDLKTFEVSIEEDSVRIIEG